MLVNCVFFITTTNNYTYDHMGRKTQTREQIGTDSTAGKPLLLVQNLYNELKSTQGLQHETLRKDRNYHAGRNVPSYL